MLKVHMSLPVADLDATEVFYSTLFDAPPSKRKADHLKFEPTQLALNISFVPVEPRTSLETGRHLGIQFSSQKELDEAFGRLSVANLVRGKRERSICCYADQDKFKVRDPDGYEWELYYRLSDSDIEVQTETSCCVEESRQSACC